MKRLARRTLGIAIGLTLGWLAAGHIPAPAAPGEHTDGPAITAAPNQEHHAKGPAEHAAALLKPAPEHTGWIKPTVIILGVWFIAALVAGETIARDLQPKPD